MDYPIAKLTKELDRTKSAVFLRRGEGHLAHLLCGVNIIWAEDAVTGYTTANVLAINPEFFMWLEPDVRETFVAYHLWRIAMLHIIRGQGKNEHLWQMACSYWVNNMLHNRGYKFDNLQPWLDHRYDDQAVEEIYEDLVLRKYDGTLDDLDALWGYRDDMGKFDENDLRGTTEAHTWENNGNVPPVDNDSARRLTNLAHKVAVYAAQSPGGYGGADPMMDSVNQFLQPKIKWEKEILPFMTALEGLDYYWPIPNRRVRHTYLPSLRPSNLGGLDHIAFFIDSSGSMTKAQLVRVNSEARYVKKRFNPEKLTLINFDDQIQMVKTMGRMDQFDEIDVVGRGGTHLEPVRQWIIEHNPVGAVIMTDMGCAKMLPLPPHIKTKLLWIVINNPSADVPQGKMVHITE